MKELLESSYLSAMSEENDRLRKEIERLHSIIKEAIEYITSINDEDIQYTIGWVKQDLLEILQGSDKEW